MALMDRQQVDAYLARIGVGRPARTGAAALRELQLAHLRTVPFENLGIHLAETIELDEVALVEKIVGRRRGGFCYELNGLFAALLEALGFTVTLMAARALGPDGPGPPFDHLALRVDAPEPWLVDVGFGRHSHHPLRLDVPGDQHDPEGTFRVTELPDGDVDITLDGGGQYRVEPRPRVLADFEPTCWRHRTSPRSHFTHGPVCTRLTGRGRITLSGATLIETAGGVRDERTLATDAEILAAYRDHFGIVLDRVPAVRAPA